MERLENHSIHRLRWLRSAVLGTNDGLVSTAGLLLGVAATGASQPTILIAAVAGLVAGTASLAASEYVSARSQADTESADLELERLELAANPEEEHAELATIYVERGLDAELASQVAVQLMEHDALGAHARDELGLSETLMARPTRTGVTSAAAFAVGAVLPLLVVILVPASAFIPALLGSTCVFLGLLGYLSALAGGASIIIAATRMVLFGAVAMALTFGVGTLLEPVV